MPCRMMPRPTSQIVVNITADADDVNLFTLAGSPAGVVDVLCTISAGVTIGATSTSTPAFRTGGFASGSTIRVVNYGRIAGHGGDGGNGGNNSGPVEPQTGDAGGDAVRLDDNVEWDNTTTGETFGGGGGGGGGGWDLAVFPNGPGGGGGGGQGSGTSSGGGGPGNADAGADGDLSGRGAGGAGSSAGAKGGGGGTWGNSGSKGGSTSRSTGKNGGSAGRAVRLNGNTITWLAGNNATQVKGSVS